MAKNKGEQSKRKLNIKLKTLLLAPTIIFFIIYFLFQIVAERSFKVSVGTYEERKEEFRKSIEKNKKREKDRQEEERIDKLKKEKEREIEEKIKKEKEEIEYSEEFQNLNDDYFEDIKIFE